VPDYASIGYSGHDVGEVLAELAEMLDRPRPWWWELAACRGKGVQRWFPERGQTAQAGAAICATCRARVECLEAAQGGGEEFGTWGGFTASSHPPGGKEGGC
jgi:hypothetical protein